MISFELALAIISVLMALVFGYSSFKSTNNGDIEKKAVETATIIVKLDNIGSDVRDIKYDMTSMKKDVQNLKERMVVVETIINSTNEKEI